MAKHGKLRLVISLMGCALGRPGFVLPQDNAANLSQPRLPLADNQAKPPALEDSQGRLLASLEKSVIALRANPADRNAQKFLFDSAAKLSRIEALPAHAEEARAEAVETARTYLKAEGNKLQRLRAQVGNLLRASANISDPMMILDASRRAQTLDPLLDDPNLEAYVNTIYERLGSALRDGRFTDQKLFHEGMGYIYFHDGKWERAQAEWEKALAADKENPALRNLVQEAKRQATDEAVSAKVIMLMAKGKAYFDSGQFEKSNQALRSLLSVQPGNAEAQRLLSLSQARLAAQEREREITEDLDYGTALRKEHKYLEASEYFLQALQLDPQNEESERNLRDMMRLLESARPAKAARPAQKPETRTSADAIEEADGYYQQGLLLYIQGKKGEAEGLWKQALAVYPAHERARSALERMAAEENFSGK